MNTVLTVPPVLAGPAPLGEVLCALKRVAPLNGLAEHEYEWLANMGNQRREAAGAVLFQDGDPATHMTILLKGEIHVRRERGAIGSIFIGRSGQITGLLPFSRMTSYGGMGYVSAEMWALTFDRALFPAMLEAIPGMGQICVGILLDRVREVTRMEQQTEKLAALGKLAANLAHELNNPASAAQRAAGGLLEELRVYGHEKFNLGSLCLDSEKLLKVRAWQESVQSLANTTGSADSPDVSLREDGISRWLASQGIENAWQIAPELAEAGVSAAQLAPLAEILQDPGATTVVLSQFTSSLRAERMTEAMINSTARIFDLIKAIKDYSYMDQAPIQEIDIPKGLEDTLTMLQSRLQHVEVLREYDPDLPCISAYASELNQVWTALIENAIDAIDGHGRIELDGHGRIELKVQLSGDLILVEVWDNGPGIPAELQDRIFEPFFTTKPPGLGLGLGLDSVMRIVRKHRGYVRVQSAPGATCFQVRLPLQQLQAY